MSNRIRPIMVLKMPYMDLRFMARMLKFATCHIIFSTVFFYIFVHLMMMHLICVFYKFVFARFCFVLGFFWCLVFGYSLVLIALTCWWTTIGHVLYKFDLALLCFVFTFFWCLAFAYSLLLVAFTCQRTTIGHMLCSFGFCS